MKLLAVVLQFAGIVALCVAAGLAFGLVAALAAVGVAQVLVGSVLERER